MEDNDIVAYRNKQPQGCTLRLERQNWECSGEPIDALVLAEYPVSIRRVGDLDAVFVDLRGPRAATTTSS